MFEDRGKGEEAKFAYDADKEFRIIARRNRLVGLWVAERLKLTEAEADAYAKSVIQADFEEHGDEDVIRKILGDLVKAGLDISAIELRELLSAKEAEARAQIGEAG